MDTSIASSDSRIVSAARAGIVLLSVAAIFVLYHFFGVTDVGYDPKRATTSVFVWLADRWRTDARSTLYAYSHLVPLVSLLIVWVRRRRLAAAPASVSWAGFALVLAALALHWAGVRAEQTRLSLLSLMLMAWAAPLFLRGRPTARLLLFPCAFLVFALPLNFFDSLTYPLRGFIAAASAAVLNGLGLATARSGSVIATMPDATTQAAGGTAALPGAGFVFDVADSTSGIFALGALMATAVLVAGLAERRWWKRAVVVLAVPLLFVAANVVRVVLVVLAHGALGASLKPNLQQALSGSIFVLVALLLLAGLHLLLQADLRSRLRHLVTPHTERRRSPW